jgi:hypothetical protein
MSVVLAGEIGDGGRSIIWTILMASGMVWLADTFARFPGGILAVWISVAPVETGGRSAVAATEPFQTVSQRYW